MALHPECVVQSGCCVAACDMCYACRCLHLLRHCLLHKPKVRNPSEVNKGQYLHANVVMQADGNSTGEGNPAGYCYKEQPEWSAYREPSFGHGTLDVINSTTALWCDICLLDLLLAVCLAGENVCVPARLGVWLSIWIAYLSVCLSVYLLVRRSLWLSANLFFSFLA